MRRVVLPLRTDHHSRTCPPILGGLEFLQWWPFRLDSGGRRDDLGALGVVGGHGGAGAERQHLPRPGHARVGYSQLGTYARYEGGSVWSDYHLSLTLRSQDDDTIGVMFRVQNSQNYYRLTWDQQRGWRRRQACGRGIQHPRRGHGALRDGADLPGRHLGAGCEHRGADRRSDVLSATDAAISGGTIALYSAGNQGSYFDDILVE